MVPKAQSSRLVVLLANLLAIFVFLSIAVYIEVFYDRPSARQPCELREHAEPGVSASVHQRLVADGYRNVRSRRVTVVPLSESTVPPRALNNVCEQRWYIARLLQRLSTSGAAVIVIDKFFNPTSCDKDDPGTRELRSAAQHSTTPIVVGLATDVAENARNNSCLILSPSLDFGSTASTDAELVAAPSPIHYGLTRLNSDIRKVPIRWPLYRDHSSFIAGELATDDRGESLAYVTATLVDPHLSEEAQMQALRRSGFHPITSFIEPTAVSQIDALKYLCAGPDRPDLESRYSMICAERKNLHVDVLGQVVVIGEELPGRDRHSLFERDVSGMYLQANYIESLLDGRYFKPLPAEWNIGLFALWITLLYLMFWFLAPEWALIVSAVTIASFWYAMLETVRWTGFYPDLRLQALGLIVLILKYVDSRGVRLSEMLKGRLHRVVSPGRT